MSRPAVPAPWSGFDDLADWRRHVSRLLAWPFDPISSTGSSPPGWFAAADLVDEKDHLLVRMDLPGIGREDIEIALDADRLTIRGERKAKAEHQGEQGRMWLCERAFGRFERSFQLPCHVQLERVKATFENGVLEVRLHKAASSSRRLIEVTGG